MSTLTGQEQWDELVAERDRLEAENERLRLQPVRPRRLGCKPVANGPVCPECDCPHTNLVGIETTTIGFMDGPENHVHDPNQLTLSFECECRQHTFEVGNAQRQCWCGWRADKQQRTGEIMVPMSQLSAARAVLKQVEWIGDEFGERCPACDGRGFGGPVDADTRAWVEKTLKATVGHAPDCALKLALGDGT